jgi:hypothetical protein
MTQQAQAAHGLNYIRARYGGHVRVRGENAISWLARRLPRRLRIAVVVNAAADASDPRRGGRYREGYAGPDGLTYADLYDGAALGVKDQRLRAQRRLEFGERSA